MKNVKKRAHFAPLFGIALIAAIILSVALTACPAEPGEDVKVTFDSDGGTPVPPQTVASGEKAVKPATDPTKEVTPDTIKFEGLYRKSDFTSAGSLKYYTFDGWYDEDDTEWDKEHFNSTPITANITLKAKWSGGPQALSPTIGSDIVAKSARFAEDNNYPVVLFLGSDVICSPMTITDNNSDLTIIGIGSERTIQLANSGGTLFTVGKAVDKDADIPSTSPGISLTIGKNITLRGIGNNTASLVQVINKAVFTMEDGSKVTGNTSSAPGTDLGTRRGQGAAVHIGISSVASGDNYKAGEGGIFNMNGGEITGNTASETTPANILNRVVGGLCADSFATINLSGGKIYDNKRGGVEFNVYFTHSVKPTLRGAPEIKDITYSINDTESTLQGITLSGFTGPQVPLNLRGNGDTVSAVQGFWLDKTVLKTATGSPTAEDVAKFKVVNWYSNTTPSGNDNTKVVNNTTHKLGDSGTNIGKLIAN